MELLFNHLSEFRFQAIEKTKIGKDISEDEKFGTTKEAILVKICSESEDDESTIEKAVDEIVDVTQQLAVNSLILFPWAHLSRDLSSPEKAIKIMDKLEKELEEEGFEVLKAPFGWYKEWELTSKGHPMSVLSRSV